MTRPSDPGFDVRISDWLEADPNLAPRDLMRTLESALPSIPQRRVMHSPWRFPPMSTFARVAIAAVAVIAIGAVGIFALQPRNAPSVGASPSALPSASHVTVAHSFAVRDASANGAAADRIVHVVHPRDLALVSRRMEHEACHGAVDDRAEPLVSDPNADIFHDPVLGDHLFVGVASQPLAGKTGDQWAADFQASSGCGPTVPITVDGAVGPPE